MMRLGPNHRTRLGRALAGTLGLGLTVNGLVMLVAPACWYHRLPGVSASGPLNGHFVRDIGCADLMVGAAVLGHALARPLRWSALTGAAGFLCLHAGVHVWELFGAAHDTGHRLARDLVPVYLPGLLAAWLAVGEAWSARPAARPRGVHVRRLAPSRATQRSTPRPAS
jgi:hypothetical protein